MQKNRVFKKKLTAYTITMVAIASTVLMLTAYAAINVTANINSSGTITASPNIALFSDSACSIPITTIDWGALSAGGTVTQTIYVKNIQGTAPLTLGMTTNNWVPTTANGPLSLTWNRQGTVLSPGQSTQATITLTASPSTSGITSFSVQITITATG